MIISVKELQRLRIKHINERIVFAGGVFDVFHPSHVRALKKLKAYGNVIVIGVVSDKRVRERKGKERPIFTQSARQEIVDAIKYVDYVVPMSPPSRECQSPTLLILENLRPNMFVCTDKKWRKYNKLIADLGVKLKLVKRVNNTSSTSIIKKILRKYKRV